MKTNRDLAALYMDVVPKAMREFRKGMRECRMATLSVQQFRILAQLWHEEAGQGVNNRDLAEQLGVSVAAMSRMVDWLVDKGFVERKQNIGDRRMVCVRLTRKGREHFAKFRQETQSRLQQRLEGLDEAIKRDLEGGLVALSEAISQLEQPVV